MAGYRKIAGDAAVLTAGALMTRFVSLSYQAWLARRIGAAGLGLWQLIASANVFAATLAVSGIRYTATRLISEELGGTEGNARGAMERCMVYALIFGCGACLLTFCGAETIGFLWIGDARTVASIRALAFALPLISVGCVFNGCFVASGKAWKSALVQAVEQLAGVGAVLLLMRGVPEGDMARECAAIAKGTLIADAVSLLLAAALYGFSPFAGTRRPAPGRLTVRMLRLALPLAMSAYARTGLTTLEHMLVPRKLTESGVSAQSALAAYGTVTGMVFPLIAFPACLLGAVAELSVPELTAAQVRGDKARIRRTVTKLLRFTALYALGVGAFLLLCADALGSLVFHSDEVGRWIRLLTPLVPVMYLDMVTDGCLKGLGEMLRSMTYNVSEALVGLALAFTLLPRCAMTGYLIMLTVCELWNFTLSFTRLVYVADLRFPLRKKQRAATRSE